MTLVGVVTAVTSTSVAAVESMIKDDIVICPWHGWEFNCNTGKAVENDDVVVKTYLVENRDDEIFIKID